MQWPKIGNGRQVGGSAPGQIAVSGASGMQIVIQEPIDCSITRCRVFLISQRTGMFPDQVVEAEAAPGGFIDQVMVVKVIEERAHSWEIRAVQGRGSVGIYVRAGLQAEEPEQSLLGVRQVSVRQIEYGGNG